MVSNDLNTYRMPAEGETRGREENKGKDLFVFISVELLTVQSCLFKEIFGNNCIVWRREGGTLTSCYCSEGCTKSRSAVILTWCSERIFWSLFPMVAFSITEVQLVQEST